MKNVIITILLLLVTLPGLAQQSKVAFTVSKSGVELGVISFREGPKLVLMENGSQQQALKAEWMELIKKERLSASREIHHPNGDREYGVALVEKSDRNYPWAVYEHLLDKGYQLQTL